VILFAVRMGRGRGVFISRVMFGVVICYLLYTLRAVVVMEEVV